ncbi:MULTISPECIES: ATP-binding cassette domain-containing protein [Peptoniphilus]|uniref:ATP-binding cassette domain-containing protein n=1 Tax=Peptoniphilus TaxID=162289 RepID=UPI002352EA60|nr:MULTISPECIES: ATP-binding cassette domain-containing protein [Peptoniphilus]MDU1043917.1 ATP-binding cassette domain-containing protein [Peptoniphilus rhinitidis]MDU1954771.1 ATP-binding cassette domain-containing protein [Peptoniphilus lacydonensis]MDU2109962.1 ATP-binding cassette domain-containing protein [Peptoniphilus lacydonensis]MDU2115699.1 ATP-binding cassette domain-containing protein [Peptoniphilus lacydonensis]MDU3750405.1 ATP-binding cassette domain-containing protein [Peptonip
MSAIVINDLTKGKGKEKVLSNLNLEILDGEFFSLLGTEDSGKTTLARIIMGYLKPSSGTIKVYDMDSFKESKEIKESVSFVPEEMIFDSKIKSYNLLKKTLKVHNLTNTEDIDVLSDYFEFNSNIRVCDLRDRERKILAILNALITKPRLLVLDNPSKFLEEKDIDRLFSHLKKLNETENLTVLLLSNSLRQAKKYSARIAYLSDGKIQEIEYNNVKVAGDKVLKIDSFRGNLNYFTSIGARIIKDEEDETILYFDGPLPELSKVIYEEALENYVLEDAQLDDKVNAYYKGENANIPRREKTVEKENLIKENKTEIINHSSKDTVETSTINGMDENTIKASKSENNFNEVDGIIPSTSEKDEIHNTKTNLFVDDEHKIKDKDVEENKNEETIIFKTSDSGVFNETEDTELKEDENDI